MSPPKATGGQPGGVALPDVSRPSASPPHSDMSFMVTGWHLHIESSATVWGGPLPLPDVHRHIVHPTPHPDMCFMMTRWSLYMESSATQWLRGPRLVSALPSSRGPPRPHPHHGKNCCLCSEPLAEPSVIKAVTTGPRLAYAQYMPCCTENATCEAPFTAVLTNTWRGTR